nr:uncharacterized protein LOC112032541 [Quercus suber]POF25088.1 hypothetical protein CFP56_79473 [Quercus suber]
MLARAAQWAATKKASYISHTAATTQENLKTINNATDELVKVVNGYQGGLIPAAGISNQEAVLSQHIKYATTDAEASEVVSEAEAEEIIKYIEETLEKTIQACMTALKNKKAELAKANLQETTFRDLEDLRKLTNKLGDILVTKAPQSKQDEGKRVNSLVDANFNDAMKFFDA